MRSKSFLTLIFLMLGPRPIIIIILLRLSTRKIFEKLAFPKNCWKNQKIKLNFLLHFDLDIIRKLFEKLNFSKIYLKKPNELTQTKSNFVLSFDSATIRRSTQGPRTNSAINQQTQNQFSMILTLDTFFTWEVIQVNRLMLPI